MMLILLLCLIRLPIFAFFVHVLCRRFVFLKQNVIHIWWAINWQSEGNQVYVFTFCMRMWCSLHLNTYNTHTRLRLVVLSWQKITVVAPQPPWKPHNKIITKWIFTQLRWTTTMMMTTADGKGKRTECGRVAIETMALHIVCVCVCVFFAACAHNAKENQTSRKKTVVIFSINSVWTCVCELNCCRCHCHHRLFELNASNKREVVTHHRCSKQSIHTYAKPLGYIQIQYGFPFVYWSCL